MPVPADRRYAESHEWFRAEGPQVTIGISQFAADELTDITYVELPKVGQRIAAGTSCAEIESVKATAEVFSALAGTVSEVNARLADEPGLLNSDPFQAGWILKLRCDDLAPLSGLMDAATYEKSVS